MLLANRNYDLFDEMFKDPFFTRPFENASSQIMKTDIHEQDGNYLIEMELPGFAREDITAEKNQTNEEKDAKGNCIRKERYTGSCNRSFYVGEQVAQEDIKAAFKDGILRLQVPKDTPKAIEEPRLITIE